jgi:MFS family permease
MANGMSAMGMGLGLMLGPLISATYLSPLLGGWRHIMYLYGAVSVVIVIVWWLTAREPAQAEQPGEKLPADKRPAVPVFQTIARLAHIPTLWLLGITIMFRSGTIMGMTGYLPLYLRNQGWTAGSADATQTIFYAASTLFVVPFTLLSDKLGSRKAVLLPMIVVTMLCVALLPFTNGFSILILMFLAGMSMDGFMATASAMVLETKGVGPAFSGTALGITFTIAQLGGLVAPPLGNSLANNNPALPFLVWASFSIVSLCTIFFTRETGWRQKQKAEAAD